MAWCLLKCRAGGQLAAAAAYRNAARQHVGCRASRKAAGGWASWPSRAALP